MYKYCLFTNGVYDVICALIIIFFDWDSPHSLIINDYPPPTKRFMAYWIFTYGIIRISGSVDGSLLLAAATYFWEAFCFQNEVAIARIETNWKHKFLYCSCHAIGIYLLLVYNLIL